MKLMLTINKVYVKIVLETKKKEKQFIGGNKKMKKVLDVVVGTILLLCIFWMVWMPPVVFYFIGKLFLYFGI